MQSSPGCDAFAKSVDSRTRGHPILWLQEILTKQELHCLSRTGLRRSDFTEWVSEVRLRRSGFAERISEVEFRRPDS